MIETSSCLHNDCEMISNSDMFEGHGMQLVCGIREDYDQD